MLQRYINISIMDIKVKTPTTTEILSKATGYSEIYCRYVLEGRRSAGSKGGIIILNKYKELLENIEVFCEGNLELQKN
jgi:hypothetical protein